MKILDSSLHEILVKKEVGEDEVSSSPMLKVDIYMARDARIEQAP